MTPGTPSPPSEPTLDPDDLGEPIAELQQLSLPADARFQRRLRSRIERRVLTGELLGLAWTAPVMALMELLRGPFELLGGRRRT